jgi:SSS family solute:Na+ symporter
MNHFPLTLSDIVVIAGYLLLVLYIGLYFRRRMRSAEDYFAGGHQVPWWLAGVSHYISSASALTFVAYSQLGYEYGFVSIVVAWTAVPGCILGGLVFARRWRQARVSTPVEFLERRFNIFVRQLMAWAGVPMKIGEDGLKLFATSLFLAVGLQIPVSWAVLACGIIAIAYTFFGGLWALAVTDYVQFLMKALALLLLVPLAVWRAGGLRHAAAALPPGFFHVTHGMYNWVYIAGFIVMLIITLNGSWSLAQKYYSVGDTRQAEKAAYLSAVLYFIGTPIMILPAILGRLFLPDLIAQHHTADVYVYLMIQLLPAGMVGIVVAALLSATMATVSADFSAIAGVLTKDVYQRLFRPHATQASVLRMGKLITLLVGSLSLVTGLYLSLGGDQQILHLMVLIATAFLAPSFLPLMAALVSRRVTSHGIVTGFFLGLATGLSLLAARAWILPHGYWPWLLANFDGASLLINTGMTVVGMWVGTLIAGTSPEDARKYDLIFHAYEAPASAASQAKSAVDLQKIISIATLAVAALLAVAGLIAPAWTARITDLAIALIIAALGWLRLHSAHKRADTKTREGAAKP